MALGPANHVPDIYALAIGRNDRNVVMTRHLVQLYLITYQPDIACCNPLQEWGSIGPTARPNKSNHTSHQYQPTTQAGTIGTAVGITPIAETAVYPQTRYRPEQS
jgi:hypothetical protein